MSPAERGLAMREHFLLTVAAREAAGAHPDAVEAMRRVMAPFVELLAERCSDPAYEIGAVTRSVVAGMLAHLFVHHQPDVSPIVALDVSLLRIRQIVLAGLEELPAAKRPAGPAGRQ